MIVGYWAFDNNSIDVLVNEVSLGIDGTGAFVAPTYFPDDAGRGLFLQGENVIEFVP